MFDKVYMYKSGQFIGQFSWNRYVATVVEGLTDLYISNSTQTQNASSLDRTQGKNET